MQGSVARLPSGGHPRARPYPYRQAHRKSSAKLASVRVGTRLADGDHSRPSDTHGKRGTLVWVRVAVTEISWDGSTRRRALGTSGLTDPGRLETCSSRSWLSRHRTGRRRRGESLFVRGWALFVQRSFPGAAS